MQGLCHLEALPIVRDCPVDVSVDFDALLAGIINSNQVFSQVALPASQHAIAAEWGPYDSCTWSSPDSSFLAKDFLCS
eukprot:5555004-Amphidinium_carterae.1